MVLGVDRGVDPDEPAVEISQRSTGVAAVDRGIGLDRVLEDAAF